MNYEGFSNLIKLNYDSSFKNSLLIILDKNDNPVYSSIPDIDIQKLSLKSLAHSQRGTHTQAVDGKDAFISYYTSLYTDWRVIAIIPAGEVFKDLVSIKYLIFAATFICMVIVLFFSSLMSSVFLRPINQMAAAMGKIEQGDFSTRVAINSKDETRYLADSFNQMAAYIENLINMVYQAELKQREAELQSLQSQINPHFLYNTLESIRIVALSCKIDSIAFMSKALSQLFTYSISQELLVPIKDELQHL